MAFYPVIMCGGAGTRLWPASRPSRPKQFIALAGNRSLFQDTVERVVGLAAGGGRLVVIGGAAHGEVIADQLFEISVEAQVLLEPQARDSAAAMAAAAAWIRRHDPDGIAAFVASDHYIPDAEAFRRAVRASADAARDGRIVTLGVRPTEASSAYGYMKPSGKGLSKVESFHEKPDTATAARFIADGYLWNSGDFIVSAATIMNELDIHAPSVSEAAVAALPPPMATASVQLLRYAFLAAPKISIDYAVMEHTDKASVLEVDFVWSDLGAWDAIARSGEGSTGIRILEDADRVLTRAPDGVVIAALGVNDIAIVVEHDAVLVCDINRSQDVKRIVARLKSISPQHLDFEVPVPEGLLSGGRWFANWLRLRALPVWSTVGFDSDGGFRESITLGGHAAIGFRRSRVQTRQIYVYSQAGFLGWQGPWKAIVSAALSRLRLSYLRNDGSSRSLLATDWSSLDDAASLYDQAFVLFAFFAAKRAGVEDEGLERDATRLRDHLLASAAPDGAMLEIGDHPYQSNAHMHIFEACLAWAEISQDPGWWVMAERIASLAMSKFIDPHSGFLREFFDPKWQPALGDDGRLLEPGHQFEWAWLLTRYGRASGNVHALSAARVLYQVGRTGVAQRPPVAIDAIDTNLSLRSRRARLWPQTEWLKAALILSEEAADDERQALLDDSATALEALRLYLTDDGVWRDKRLPSGDFMDEPAPATSFYHILMAFSQLSETLGVLGMDGGESLALD